MKIVKLSLMLLIGLMVGAVLGGFVSLLFYRKGNGGYNIDNQIISLVSIIVGSLAGVVIGVIIALRKRSSSSV